MNFIKFLAYSVLRCDALKLNLCEVNWSMKTKITHTVTNEITRPPNTKANNGVEAPKPKQ